MCYHRRLWTLRVDYSALPPFCSTGILRLYKSTLSSIPHILAEQLGYRYACRITPHSFSYRHELFALMSSAIRTPETQILPENNTEAYSNRFYA